MRSFTTTALLLVCLLAGCDDSSSRLAVDPTDKAALEQYEKAIKEADEAMANSASTPIP